MYKYYDLKSPIDNPRLVIIDIQFKQKFKQTLVLKVIKQMTNDQQVELEKKNIAYLSYPYKSELELLLNKFTT